VRSLRGRATTRRRSPSAYKAIPSATFLNLPSSRRAQTPRKYFPQIQQKLATLVESVSATSPSASPRPRFPAAEAPAHQAGRELSKNAKPAAALHSRRPTTGLHFDDVRSFSTSLATPRRSRQHRAHHRAPSRRHQRQADWVIDLGPEGGEARPIVAKGPPELVARTKSPHRPSSRAASSAFSRATHNGNAPHGKIARASDSAQGPPSEADRRSSQSISLSRNAVFSCYCPAFPFRVFPSP